MNSKKMPKTDEEKATEGNLRTLFAPELLYPEHHQSDDGSSPSSPASKPVFLTPNLYEKRGFVSEKLKPLQSISSLTLKHHPSKSFYSAGFKKFNEEKTNQESTPRIGEMAKILIKNTENLRPKTLNAYSQEVNQSQSNVTKNPNNKKISFNDDASIPEYSQVEDNQRVVKKLENKKLQFQSDFGTNFNQESTDKIESEEEIKSNCLKNFSCVRLENLRQSCSIS